MLVIAAKQDIRGLVEGSALDRDWLARHEDAEKFGSKDQPARVDAQLFKRESLDWTQLGLASGASR
jgi:hypothetical protein